MPDSPPFRGGGSAGVIDQAESVRAHVFDLLGSGASELAADIDWSLDFKSGCRWPLRHFSRLSLQPAPGCDIKVPWELGRFNHLAPLVEAYALTADPTWAWEIRNQVEGFLERNPVEYGVQWMSAMDAAIRAANWTYALAFLAGEPEISPEFRSRWLASLWEHARFVRKNLSANPHSRGNHYLCELVGLLHVGLAFGHTRQGRRLAEFALRRIGREMRHQVYPDGTSWEASTNYHRLVTELFAQAATLARRTTVPLRARFDPEFDDRLRDMFALVHDYTRPDGTAPLIGDVDDGRLLAFAGYALDPRRHRDSLAVYEEWLPSRPAASSFRELGGLFILRAPEAVVAIRCGRVGLRGRGAHDHADQLAVDVTLAGVPLFVDPGSYVYTADPLARSEFRATRAHNTIELDGQNQMTFSEFSLFEVDREATGWVERVGEEGDRVVFRGHHDGYSRLPEPVVHHRAVLLERSGRGLRIEDRLEGPGARHQARVTFQTNADCALATIDERRCLATIRAGRRHFRWTAAAPDGLRLQVEEGWVSPRYGVRRRAPRLVLAGEIEVPAEMAFEISVAP